MAYASSTGLNILTAMLEAFDPADPLSAKAVEKLQAFQAQVPPVAYTTALTHPEALAGVIALSTYLPAAVLVDAEATPANRSIPVLAMHGSVDDVVSPALGRAARDFLNERGYAVLEFPDPQIDARIERIKANLQALDATEPPAAGES